MKNKKLNHLLFWIFVFTISILLNSCRSVKKDKTVVKESLTTEIATKEHETAKEESNVKEVVETKTNSTTGITTKKTTTRPVDPTKPATKTDSKGNKTTLNNAETVEEETTTNNTTVVNQLKNLQESAKKERAKQLEENKKESAKLDQDVLKLERSFPIGWLLIAIGVLAVGLIAWYNRLNIIKWFKNIWWI